MGLNAHLYFLALTIQALAFDVFQEQGKEIRNREIKNEINKYNRTKDVTGITKKYKYFCLTRFKVSYSRPSLLLTRK